MIWKILTLAGVAIAVWSMVRRFASVAQPPPPPPVRAGSAQVEDLVRCAACGAWKAPAAPCACQIPPTP